MKRLVIALLLCAALPAGAADWILATTTGRADSGARFEVILIAPDGEPLPEAIALRLKDDPLRRGVIRLAAKGPAAGARRSYEGTIPAGFAGAIAFELADRPSSALVLVVGEKRDAVQALTTRRSAQEAEPPLSENDPMYFVVGAREGWDARFQLSFKYRLFDTAGGFGRDRPWLAGLYFGYTQNSLWDLSTKSRPFRDTSYRPSVFWKWERTDERSWIDAARIGVEHESNGRDGPRSRSIDTLFVRPEWRKTFADGSRLEFTPKLYGYLDKDDNPDIHRYRGYADWRARYDSGGDWIATAVARLGTAGKGSLLLDLSKRTRDLQFGPVSGYLHVQFFNGYGEDILDYNFRRRSQLRVGFAIVP